MKKFIFLVAVILVSVITAMAQPRAIGARLGYNTEVSYQHSMSKKTYAQLDAGLYRFGRGAQVVGTYNFIFATPNWTPYGTWEWFAGGGVGVGVDWRTYWRWTNHYTYVRYPALFLGVAGNVGLAFNFEFPLQVAVDFRPMIGPEFLYGSIRFHREGLFAPAISARYRFK